MTINFFLLIALILGIYIFLNLLIYKKKKYSINSIFINYSVLALLIVMSFLTIHHYTKRSDSKYYKNRDFYILKHKGYEFTKGKELFLYHDSADISLLGGGYGQLSLISDKANDSIYLNTHHFDLPLYYKPYKKEYSFPLNYIFKKSDEFNLLNNRIDKEIISGSTLIIKKGNEDTLLQLRYEEVTVPKNFFKNKTAYCFYFKTQNALEEDTFKLNNLHFGYDLTALLSKGLKTTVEDDMQQLFYNSCFVRKDINIEVRGKQKTTPLYFFPGNNLLNTPDISILINNQEVDIEAVNAAAIHTAVNNGNFYAGLSFKNKIEFITSVKDSTTSLLKYKLPEMLYFPKDTTTDVEKELFVTTSLKDIIDNVETFSNFFKFAHLSKPENIYNASFIISYIDSTPNIPLSPVLYDFNTVQDEFNQGIQEQDLNPGEEFLINSRFVNTNDCLYPLTDSLYAEIKYIFEIENLNNNLVTQNTKKNYLFLLFLFTLLYFFLGHYIKKSSNRDEIFDNKWLFFETLIYLILISFLTVRLILLWRLHTFPPLENITYHEYSTILNKNNYKLTFLILYALLIIRLIWFICKCYFIKKTKKISIKFPQTLLKKIAFVFIAYLILFIIYFLFKTTFATIPLFLLLYVVFYGFISKDEDEYFDNGANNPKLKEYLKFKLLYILNAFFILFFWAVFEKGMIIPFLIFMSLVIIIETLFRKKQENSKSKNNTEFKWVKGIKLFFAYVVFLFLIFQIAFNSFNKNLSFLPQTAYYRLRTLHLTPDQLFENVEFNSVKASHILNATSNYWFIENHLDYRSKNELKNSFALNHKFTQMGVNYVNQTRDLVVLRYVIFEHGHRIIFGLLFLLLIVILVILLLFKMNNSDSHPQLKIPLLLSVFLFVFSLYIYLLNLNLVAFIGQDFPYLTLTSGMTASFLPFVLFCMLFSIKTSNLDDCFKTFDKEKDIKLSTRNKVLISATFLSIIIYILSAQSIKDFYRGKQANVKGAYKVITPVASLDKFVNTYVNPYFVKQQDINKNQYDSLDLNTQDLINKIDILFIEDKNIDKLLTYYIKKEQDSTHKAFIKSAFLSYFQTTGKDLNHIIHLKRRGDKFVFIVNSNYYLNNQIFKDKEDKTQWCGNLVAAKTNYLLHFVNLDGSYKNIENNSFDTVKKVDSSKLRNKIFNYFTLYIIPSRYTFSNNNIVVLDPNIESKENINLNTREKSFFSENLHNFYPILICDGDRINVNNDYISIEKEKDKYYAINLNYNNKNQFFYPLGKDFIFAYSFVNMLEDVYKPDNPNEPVRLSIDYYLTEQTNRIIVSDTAIRVKDATVVALDGNGKVRLLFDMHPNQRHIDPNNENEFEKTVENIYFEDNKEAERNLFQNRNLRIIEKGPGSTIKPIFYTAITSKINFNWTDFKVHNPPSNERFYKYNTDKNRWEISHISENKINPLWPEYDDYYKTDLMDVNQFIYTSNNIFHAILLILGSYDIEKLKELKNYVYNISDRRTSKILTDFEPPLFNFPRLRLNNRFYYFTKDFNDEYKLNYISILQTGLKDNFGFIFREAGTDDDFSFISNIDIVRNCLTVDKNSKYFEHVVPQQNHIYANIDRDNFSEILFSLNKGAYPLRVTPIKMAEMGLRIFSLNKELCMTYDEDKITNNLKFNISPTYSDSMQFINMLQNTLYLGMWNAFRNDAGTLRSSRELQIKKEQEGIYIYGKTGTSGGLDKYGIDRGFNNLFYLIILTNQKMHEGSINFNNLKTYSIFIGFYNQTNRHSGFKTIRRKIIEAVTQSETFKNYWHE